MIRGRTLDVSRLRPFDISSQAPLWWGQMAIVFIESTMFLILVAMYFYFRLTLDVWPPPGEIVPGPLGPTLALVPLLLSAVGSYIASAAAKENNRGKMIFGMALNVVLALVFFALRLLEWRSLNFNWASSVHGSIVWTILGLHSLDYIADVVFTVALLILVARRNYGPKVLLGVHVDSVVWYFLVVIWFPLYGVIYWGPRVAGTR